MGRPEWLPDDAPDILDQGDLRNRPRWHKVLTVFLGVLTGLLLPIGLLVGLILPGLIHGYVASLTVYLLFAGVMTLLVIMIFGAIALVKPRDDRWVISSDGVRWEDGSHAPLCKIKRVRFNAIELQTGSIKHIAGSGDARQTRRLLRRLLAEHRSAQDPATSPTR